MLAVKDSAPLSLRSCAGCNACYIGQTTRHIYTCLQALYVGQGFAC